MEYRNMWDQEMRRQLHMCYGKRHLVRACRRANLKNDIYHLIIGLGGTGCQAVLETKGLIELTCDNPSRHVAYLAIDTDHAEATGLKVSDRTGEIHFDGVECCLLDSADIAHMFEPDALPTLQLDWPELFTWVDTSLTSPSGANNGAGQCRQIGRLILHRNYNLVKRHIVSAIQKMMQDGYVQANAHLQVSIIAGLSGGTGSGTFIDMPFIVEEVLNNFPFGFAETYHSISGYFFMPDVNAVGRGGDPNLLYGNAYAALQELDYVMSLPDGYTEESFDIHFPGKTIHVCGRAPYDMVHLVSATRMDGLIVAEPYSHCIQTVAQSILSFVVDEAVQWPHMSHIDLNYPIRHHTFLAIGAAQYELPIDDIMMYVASLLFDSMKGMLDNRPTDAEAVHGFFTNILGWDVDNMIARLARCFPDATLPAMPSVEQLKRGEWNWIQAGQNAYQNICSNIAVQTDAILKVTDECIEHFLRMMEAFFQNPDQGPVYVHQLISNADYGLLGWIEIEQRKIDSYCYGYSDAKLDELLQHYRYADNELRRAILPNTKERRKDEVNQIGRMYYIGSVRLALASVLHDIVYPRIANTLVYKNDKLFAAVAQVFIDLQSVFRDNASILTRDRMVDSPAFVWDKLSVYMMCDMIKTRFDGIVNGKVENVIDDFCGALWEEAKVWVANPYKFDPRGFVSGFVNKQFGSIAGLSIEEVVEELLRRDGDHAEPLDVSVKRHLMPKLLNDAMPLYYQNMQTLTSFAVQKKRLMLISVPECCEGIYRAISEYCITAGINGNCILQRSSISDQIRVQTILCPLSLADFQCVQQAERAYAANTERRGLHLVHAVDPRYSPELRTWNDLPTLIPEGIRASGELTASVRALLRRDADRKERVRTQIGTPIVHLDKDPSKWPVWELCFTLTDAEILASGNVLHILRGNIPVAKFVRNVEADMDMLNAICRDGLASIDCVEAHQQKIRMRTINNPQNGSVDEARTLDRLLETCLCSFELLRSFDQELRKYETIREWMREDP